MHGKAGSEGARKGGHGYSVAKTGHDGLRGRPVVWATQQDMASFEFRAEDEKSKRKQVKKQRKQAELQVRINATWRKVVKAAGQGAQPMERVRAVVQAMQRRAEQGQLLLQAADRGVEGVRSRGILDRALYSWGLGHARDRARYSKVVVLVGVWSGMMVQCRASIAMGSVIDRWYTNRDCDRAWVHVCSKYEWYYMHKKLVQGLPELAEKVRGA